MSRKIRLALMGVAILLVAVLCWFFLLSPIRGEIAETDEAIEDQLQQVSLAKTTLAQAESMREEGKGNQARLLELNKMVPPEEELPSLLLQLQDLADQSGIEFIAVTPGSPSGDAEGADYLVLPLDLEFSGTYFDVSDFAYRAEHMVAGPGRLLAIESLDLAAAGAAESGVSPELGVSMSLYAFLQSAQQPAPAAAPSEESSDQ